MYDVISRSRWFNTSFRITDLFRRKQEVVGTELGWVRFLIKTEKFEFQISMNNAYTWHYFFSGLVCYHKNFIWEYNWTHYVSHFRSLSTSKSLSKYELQENSLQPDNVNYYCQCHFSSSRNAFKMQVAILTTRLRFTLLWFIACT